MTFFLSSVLNTAPSLSCTSALLDRVRVGFSRSKTIQSHTHTHTERKNHKHDTLFLSISNHPWPAILGPLCFPHTLRMEGLCCLGGGKIKTKEQANSAVDFNLLYWKSNGKEYCKISILLFPKAAFGKNITVSHGRTYNKS